MTNLHSYRFVNQFQMDNHSITHRENLKHDIVVKIVDWVAANCSHSQCTMFRISATLGGWPFQQLRVFSVDRLSHLIDWFIQVICFKCFTVCTVCTIHPDLFYHCPFLHFFKCINPKRTISPQLYCLEWSVSRAFNIFLVDWFHI